jgi:putative DNA primase/helicase
VDRKAVVLERLDVAALVADLFPRLDRAGVNQVLVSCPVHEDQHASCSVNTSTGLWNCKACGAKGPVFDLYMAARGVDFATALHDLEARAGIVPPLSAGSAKRRPASSPPVKPSPAKPATAAKPKTAPRVKGKTVAVYRYFDAAGVCRYLKRRIEPGRSGRKKEFAFAHFLPDGSEAPGRGDNPPLIYGLHRLVTAPPGALVFVVEGEGKADALTAWGLVAVCTDSGAAGRWPSSFNEFFTGRTVVILPDNDEPGEKYAARVAAALLPVADCVKVLRLPGLPQKGDLLDYISMQRKGAAPDA